MFMHYHHTKRDHPVLNAMVFSGHDIVNSQDKGFLVVLLIRGANLRPSVTWKEVVSLATNVNGTLDEIVGILLDKELSLELILDSFRYLNERKR